MSAVEYPLNEPRNVYHKGRKEWGVFLRPSGDWLTFDASWVYFPQEQKELLVSNKFLRDTQS